MTDSGSTTAEQRSWLSQLRALWFVVPLIVGLALSVWLVPVPKVGIVRLEGDIYDQAADHVVDQLNYARNDPSIRAVVLRVNSPGGGVTASENLYYSILSFRADKPLVVSIDTLAASGGYYAASAGDVIFAKPSSSIGNIGVVSLMPAPTFVDEELISTGPFKLFGSSRAAYVRELDILKQGFLEAVLAQRGDKIELDEESLARGEIFVGILALDIGLIDALGTVNDAVEEAARLAKIANYQTLELNTVPGLEPPELPPITFGGQDSRAVESDNTQRQVPEPGLYYLPIGDAEAVL